MTQADHESIFRELADAGWDRIPDDGFIELVGPIWRFRSTEVEHYAIYALPKHRNRRGVVQGGMLMTLADRAMGATARKNDPSVAQATVQLNMNFLDAARIGELLIADCRIDRSTRSLVFVGGVLRQGERIVGTCSGVWKIFGK